MVKKLLVLCETFSSIMYIQYISASSIVSMSTRIRSINISSKNIYIYCNMYNIFLEYVKKSLLVDKCVKHSVLYCTCSILVLHVLYL